MAAGGVAALLASGGGDKPAPTPVAQYDTVDVLIAKGDIGIGQVVSAQDLQWQAWPAATTSPNFVRKSDRPDAIEKLAGSVARSTFFAGEPIRDSKLVKIDGSSGYMAAALPAGMRAISTEISPETGAGGFILPGDHVDVILSKREKENERGNNPEANTSETILSNVRVLAIDQTVEEKNGQKVVVGKTATLEMRPRQAETLALARQLGTLSLSLRSIVDIGKTNEPDDEDDKRTGVNMVRFGVTKMTMPK